jgi:serine/threonine protein kinase
LCGLPDQIRWIRAGKMTSSAPPKSVAIEPGTRLDRYELLCLLAHGGMANVWLARVRGKHGFNKLLAIKTILQNESENETFREMFLDEAKIASRITHPSVVHIVDVGELQGIPYLVMDLIEGEPWRRCSAMSRTRWPRAARWWSAARSCRASSSRPR